MCGKKCVSLNRRFSVLTAGNLLYRLNSFKMKVNWSVDTQLANNQPLRELLSCMVQTLMLALFSKSKWLGCNVLWTGGFGPHFWKWFPHSCCWGSFDPSRPETKLPEYTLMCLCEMERSVFPDMCNAHSINCNLVSWNYSNSQGCHCVPVFALVQ